MIKIKHRYLGFSLIEISIVLSIVGILMGFTLKGRGLIETAKIRSVVSQIENYRSAVQIFTEKYSGRPGDISDAKDLFNASENGRMDGQIGSIDDIKRFWDHLAKSGEITINNKTGLPTTKLGGVLLVTQKEGQYWLVLCREDSSHNQFHGFLSENIAKRIESSMDNGDLSSGDVIGEKANGEYYMMFKL